jgi:glycolate oxidase
LTGSAGQAPARGVAGAALLADEEDMRPYDCDGLTAYRQLPLLVALPENEAQAQADPQDLLRAARADRPARCRHRPLGRAPRRIPTACWCRSPSSRRSSVSIPCRAPRWSSRGCAIWRSPRRRRPTGSTTRPIPSSQIACTIGGNVAENAGGVHCLKYGLTVHNVMRVRGLTIDGEIVEFGNAALDAPGYDLLALVNGSEGLLAMITEVTVRLTPKPELAQVVIASFDDVRQAGDAVASIIAAGIIPAGLEMMDKKAMHAVEPYVNAGYDLNAEAILLCESDGTPEEVAEEIGRMKAVLEKSGAAGIRVSQNEAERLKFWAGRKAAFPAVGRMTPRLSVHGRHDSAQAPGRDARSDRRPDR